MAIIDRIQLKKWFQRGMRPLASQFADWIDSYWHKNDKISMTAIENLAQTLNEKANKPELTLEIQNRIEGDEILLQQIYNFNNRGGSVEKYNDLYALNNVCVGDVYIVEKDNDVNGDEKKSTYIWDGENWLQISNLVDIWKKLDKSEYYNFINTKGKINGFASLDNSGKVPLEQLPNICVEENTPIIYEESKWIPLIRGSGNGAGADIADYTKRIGYYVRNGNYVTLFMDIIGTFKKTPSSIMVVEGVPFMPFNTNTCAYTTAQVAYSMCPI